MLQIDPKKVEDVLDEMGILCELEESPTRYTSWTEYLVLSEIQTGLCLSVMRRKVLGEVQFNENGEPLDIDEIDGEHIFREEDGYYLGYDFEIEEEYGQISFTEINDEVFDWLSHTNFLETDLNGILLEK